MEHELKEIRYQSGTYARLETWMNRVNEASIKEAHRRQMQNKAVGVDGITKAEYGEKPEREGKYRLGVRTSKKKLKAKKQTVKKWLHDNMHKPIANTMQTIERALQGHFNYYGVNGNLAQIYKFWKYVKYTYYKALNKRRQKEKYAVQDIFADMELLRH